MSTLERAIAIAIRAHEGATDKGGHPYILHPLRVMLGVDSTDERIAAVLHDVIEDTAWTMAQLREEGFSETMLKALEALTKQPGEDYLTFVRRAGTNPLAKTVKLADLADNMDLSRIPDPAEDDFERYLKYREAFEVLQAEGTQQTAAQGNSQLKTGDKGTTDNRVVLRNVDDAQGTRHLQVSLKREGDLVIEGQDLGAGVKSALGVYEYEWAWTIRAADVPLLLDALGATSDVLLALREQFSDDRAADLGSFLESHDIPYETWSRMGD
jgi:hypothetical protein